MSENIDIIPYESTMAKMWDEFVRTSRNGTFLLQRGYMDYHSDRFEDCSLLAVRKEKIISILPCCRRGNHAVSSHAGLTYGSWILPPHHHDGAVVLDIFQRWIDYLRRDGVSRVDYKPVPYIYADVPSQEDLYALFRCGFTLHQRLISSTVDLRGEWKFDMSKRQQVRKASRMDVSYGESNDWGQFYSLLIECLRERHEAAPVHSLSELMLLKDRFDEQIRLFAAIDASGIMHAAVVIYDTGLVAHSQYAATSNWGRKNYMLTALYHTLMTGEYAARRYFDFGTSNEQGGQVLNRGLLSQKFSMGGTGVAYDTYILSI